MKKRLVVMLICASLIMIMTSCAQKTDEQEGASTDPLTADCQNGNYVGQELDSGVIAFKGIPYAKPPVGELRWKAPEMPDASDETYQAYDFGKTSLQYEWFSEPASFNNEVGEDCLTLNVWTAGLNKEEKKPVMVFIHGGGFAWGGTSDPLYDGQFFVEENKDIVMVTINYRVGMMGMIDLSKVPGGEAFPDSANLSTLDQIAALKWVNQNIEAFGGDPKNVTIFGESAGGAYVSLLMASQKADGLFQKCIAQSGGYALTYSQEAFDNVGLTEALIGVTGATSMDDLMALSEDQLKEAYFKELDEDGYCLNDLYNMPMRDGKIIPENPYQALADGQGSDVILMAGSNGDEYKYWIDEMNMGSEESNVETYAQWIIGRFDSKYENFSDGEKKMMDQFIALQNGANEVDAKTEWFNDFDFRVPATEAAARHADAGGTSYVYYWDHPSTIPDRGACHASELSYIFHNLDNTMFSGTVDEDLADKMCTSWANFARYGDPSIDEIKWKPYTSEERATMVMKDDFAMENDVLSEQRKILEPFLKHYIRD